MNIAIAVNDKFVKYACVMLTSLFESNIEHAIELYVLYSDISEEGRLCFQNLEKKYNRKIYMIKVNVERFPDELPHNEEWPMEVYYRLALVEVLPQEIDRILYLDVDIIVKESVLEFYNTDFAGKSLCACKDMSVRAQGISKEQYELFAECITNDDFEYFNSGVLLMNISKMRKNASLDFFIKKGLEVNIAVADQDLLNYIYYKDVKLVDEYKYDLFAKIAYNEGRTYEWVKNNVSIIHFAGRKPWHYNALHYEIERFWWEYAKLTPYYEYFLEEMVLGEVDSSCMDRLVRGLEKEKRELLDTLGKCMALLKRMG